MGMRISVAVALFVTVHRVQRSEVQSSEVQSSEVLRSRVQRFRGCRFISHF